MDLQLAPGTILDERYRIVRTLGQGGFGITYLAENIRLSMPVAIKELFWRDHCVRSEEIPSRVVLRHSREAQMFAAQMERFLREARALRDYADQPGVVRILDYFEANATAYIVMEYIEGETLSQKIEQEGPFSEEQAVRAMLPLARSLAGIHSGGLIHRDISPENIMVRQDGSLTLIDFGAARPLTQKKSFTAIGKDHYAAPEQHDEKGKQGPWTDVYGFCATLYFCVTGTPPSSAVQRLFLDELVAPSSLAPALSNRVDVLVLKGLDMDRSRRFQDMAMLAQEMEKLLPQDQPHPVHRGWIWLAAALLLVAVGLGAWQYADWRQANPFYGMETFRFLLTPGKDLSAREYSDYQEKLRARLSDFAGPDRYRIRQEGVSLEVTVPASVFGSACADEVLPGILFDETDQDTQRAIQLETEILVNWEDPSASLMPGEHQVLPSSFSDVTMLFVYEPMDSLSRGEQAGLIVDLKTRLDALDTSYAFGIQRGTEDRYVFRLTPSHVGRAVLDTIGSNSVNLGSTLCRLPHFLYSGYRGSSDLSVRTERDGRRVVVCEEQYGWDSLGKLSEVCLRYGEDHLYLMTDDGYPFLEGRLTEPVTDGPFLLDHLRFTDEQGQADFMFDYLDTLVNQTYLPSYCYFRAQRLVDAEGRTLLGQMSSSLYGLTVPMTSSEAALREDLLAFAEDCGLTLSFNGSSRDFWMDADLPLDADFSEKAMDLIRKVLSARVFAELRSAGTVFLVLADEEKYSLCRLVLNTHMDTGTTDMYTEADLYVNFTRAPSPQKDALVEAWDQLEMENYAPIRKYTLPHMNWN